MTKTQISFAVAHARLLIPERFFSPQCSNASRISGEFQLPFLRIFVKILFKLKHNKTHYI